jgi:hypothetical protein
MRALRILLLTGVALALTSSCAPRQAGSAGFNPLMSVARLPFGLVNSAFKVLNSPAAKTAATAALMGAM